MKEMKKLNGIYIKKKLTLPKADLINAHYSIPFCNPQYFDIFWTTIVNSININGRFSGKFFGDRVNIEHFEEREYNGKTAFGNLKHWHLFNVIAKK